MRILAVVGGLAILVGIGAAVFFFAGYYSVAGTAEDPAIVHWALTQVRSASINRYAHDQPPPAININEPATVQAGAAVPAATSRNAASCARNASAKRSMKKLWLGPVGKSLWRSTLRIGTPWSQPATTESSRPCTSSRQS